MGGLRSPLRQEVPQSLPMQQAKEARDIEAGVLLSVSAKLSGLRVMQCRVLSRPSLDEVSGSQALEEARRFEWIAGGLGSRCEYRERVRESSLLRSAAKTAPGGVLGVDQLGTRDADTRVHTDAHTQTHNEVTCQGGYRIRSGPRRINTEDVEGIDAGCQGSGT